MACTLYTQRDSDIWDTQCTLLQTCKETPCRIITIALAATRASRKMYSISADSHGSYLFPDSKVHGANMGPIWGRQDPGGPHVSPVNFAIWVALRHFDGMHFKVSDVSEVYGVWWKMKCYTNRRQMMTVSFGQLWKYSFDQQGAGTQGFAK